MHRQPQLHRKTFVLQFTSWGTISSSGGQIEISVGTDLDSRSRVKLIFKVKIWYKLCVSKFLSYINPFAISSLLVTDWKPGLLILHHNTLICMLPQKAVNILFSVYLWGEIWGAVFRKNSGLFWKRFVPCKKMPHTLENDMILRTIWALSKLCFLILMKKFSTFAHTLITFKPNSRNRFWQICLSETNVLALGQIDEAISFFGVEHSNARHCQTNLGAVSH